MIDWLGIGAQRSGTTWFTSLVLQHPEVNLGVSNVKELHYLDGAVEHLDAERVRSSYAAEFDGVVGMRGEFSPSYLRALFAADLAASTIAPTVVVAILRDPIDRFESTMSLALSRNDPPTHERLRAYFFSQRAVEAQWAGMYAQQLEHWARRIGRQKLLVVQYEQFASDPAPIVNEFWKRLGLDPVILEGVELPSSTSSTVHWQPDRQMQLHWNATLADLYMPQMKVLQDEWLINPELWSTLSEASHR